jgi:predicted enzyme related to lactoylglutathione lyase
MSLTPRRGLKGPSYSPPPGRRRERRAHGTAARSLRDGPGPDHYPGHVTVYVEVPDVEAALAKAESLGGSRVMGPEEVMNGLVIGLFNDPEGHLVGVVK